MLHELKTIKKKRKRVGRGGCRGKNSGTGHKGQKSRAGKNIRPAIRDVLQKIPKRRGHNKNRARGVRNRDPVRTITLDTINRNFKKGDKISPSVLSSVKLVSQVKGRVPKVKIVARGEITFPISISRCEVSAGAKEKITASGGTIK